MGEKRLYRTHLRHVARGRSGAQGDLLPDRRRRTSSIARLLKSPRSRSCSSACRGPGLPHHEREVLVELALDHLARGGANGLGERGARPACPSVSVHRRRGVLHDGERAQHLHRHLLAADLEVLQRPLRLRAPVLGSRGPARRPWCRSLLAPRRFVVDVPTPPLHERVDAVRAAVEVRAVRDDPAGLRRPPLRGASARRRREPTPADLPRFVRGGGRVVMRRVLRHYCALSEGSARAGAGDAMTRAGARLRARALGAFSTSTEIATRDACEAAV